MFKVLLGLVLVVVSIGASASAVVAKKELSVCEKATRQEAKDSIQDRESDVCQVTSSRTGKTDPNLVLVFVKCEQTGKYLYHAHVTPQGDQCGIGPVMVYPR
jgi:hypothetical protein